MRQLSKSKLLAYRQCPKRLWLELHRPELRDDSGAEMAFAFGNDVGEIARTIYDPLSQGHLIDVGEVGWDTAFSVSSDWLREKEAPIFEAALRIPGALALADIMLPQQSQQGLEWHLIEVKASTRVKDHHHDDIAIQAFIARESGLPICKVSLAHIESSFVYHGGDHDAGLLSEVDLTTEVFARSAEVRSWIDGAQEIALLPEEPAIEPGPQCHRPFTCAFCSHCIVEKAMPDYPLTSFYRLRASGIEKLEAQGYQSVAEVPADQLNFINQRIRECSISGEAFFDQKSAAAELAKFRGAPRFLDFETISFAVPIWAESRPYQQLPFQFSLHSRDRDGAITHHEFLDISGDDPRQAMAHALVAHCGKAGPIFAYHAPFERRVVELLIAYSPEISIELRGILHRIEDLLPIARAHYYHPSQHGSWSIKAVLPALCPELSYDDLEGVQDGSLAQQAYLEAAHNKTTPERREEIRQQLLAYCQLDTLALVKIWEIFSRKSRQTLV